MKSSTLMDLCRRYCTFDKNFNVVVGMPIDSNENVLSIFQDNGSWWWKYGNGGTCGFNTEALCIYSVLKVFRASFIAAGFPEYTMLTYGSCDIGILFPIEESMSNYLYRVCFGDDESFEFMAAGNMSALSTFWNMVDTNKQYGGIIDSFIGKDY